MFSVKDLSEINQAGTDAISDLSENISDDEKKKLEEFAKELKRSEILGQRKIGGIKLKDKLEAIIKVRIVSIFPEKVIQDKADPDKNFDISLAVFNNILELVVKDLKEDSDENAQDVAIKNAIIKIINGGGSSTASSSSASSDAGSTFKIGADNYKILIEEDQTLLFFKSIKLFFSNGGGTCYIVSVGTYEGLSGITIDQKALLGEKEENNKVVEGGLKKLLKEQEPTLVVIPEAVLLGANCYEVYKQVLMHCGKMQNRFAIFDLHDGDIENDETQNSNVSRFREGIGSDNLSYGAVYYPWLDTNVIQKDEVTFKNLDDLVDLSEILPEPIAKTFVKENKEKSSAENDPSKKKNLEDNYHLGLIATSPTYSALLDEIRYMMNKMPAAPAMAGKYTAVDNSRGVWKAPANVSLNSVVKPMVNITHDNQENLNVDAVSGKSINAIRTFPGVGTLVWGGRTLNGNSLDWQYINVRRTIIMLEQSIKLALRSYVFEPNDANTWITVKSMIVNFLTEKWKQGALAGSSPEDAFDVQIGLGATMTGLDILQGKMLVSVKLAIVRPAEFIVVTFQQQMQKS
ncbi:phage tail sheath family protein [Cognataquiflexum aquatile]|uniref:phage tail sheath family protein n=1 Tax=Cognataquiflexum aquatile TaxID=2249427 RepID=UPI001E467FDE|nr:phage tail sheath C-terminal domain-containing protein [Cognataquiflexum aquatile]